MKNILIIAFSTIFSIQLQAQTPVFTINGPAISNIAFTSDGKHFAVTGDSYSAGYNSSGKIEFNSSSNLLVFNTSDFTAAENTSDYSSYTNAFDKSNAKNITASVKGKSIILNIPNTKAVILKGHKANVLNVIINKEGTMAISTADEPLTIVWNTLTGAILKSFDSRKISMAFSNDGKFIVLDGAVYNAEDFSFVRSFAKGANVFTVAMSNNGKYIAVSYEIESDSRKSYVKLFNLLTGEELAKYITPGENQTEWRAQLVFSPDDKYLAGNCNVCKSIYVYDVSAFTSK